MFSQAEQFNAGTPSNTMNIVSAIVPCNCKRHDCNHPPSKKKFQVIRFNGKDVLREIYQDSKPDQRQMKAKRSNKSISSRVPSKHVHFTTSNTSNTSNTPVRSTFAATSTATSAASAGSSTSSTMSNRKLERKYKSLRMKEKELEKKENELKKRDSSTRSSTVVHSKATVVVPSKTSVVHSKTSVVPSKTSVVPYKPSNGSLRNWNQPDYMATYKEPQNVKDLTTQQVSYIRAGKYGQLGINENTGSVVSNRANGGLYAWTDNDIKNYGQLGIAGFYGQDPKYDAYAGNTHYR